MVWGIFHPPPGPEPADVELVGGEVRRDGGAKVLCMPTKVCRQCDVEFTYAPQRGAPRKDCDECRVIKIKSPAARAADNENSRRYYHLTKNTPEGRRRRRNTVAAHKAKLAAGEIQHWRKLYPDMAQMVDLRRRSAKYGGPGEHFAPIDVYERDEWICWLCKEPIDASKKYPEPRSPSVDHVLPLSRGGLHAMSNVKAAHLLCNVRRGVAGVPDAR